MAPLSGHCTPLIAAIDPGEIVAWDDIGPVDAASFLAQVDEVAAQLPQRAYLLNFCADRYRFAVTFCAGLLRGQVAILFV